MAAKWQLEELEKIQGDFEEFGHEIDDSDESPHQVIATNKIIDTIERLKRIEKSDMIELLISSHLLSLFTLFDAYTGELLKAIYMKKPDLFKSLNRSMAISDMLKYENIDDIKLIILHDEIESFRRKSYIEQFESLESRFSIELRKFKHWPLFVECSQRRNLITHCDGIVSDQYINICNKEGCVLSDKIIAGHKLNVSSAYLGTACNLIAEVGLKLGQSLWRKLFEDELNEADGHLHTTQYDYLKNKQWHSAIIAGEFSNNLPKYSSEVTKIIMLINYAIALKFSDKDNDKKVNTILDNVDWSALCSDFRLAELVLREKFKEAADLMKQIGKSGKFVSLNGYHDWPLLEQFRETEEFRTAYEEIYSHQFTNQLKKSTDKAKLESEQEVSKKKEALSDNKQKNETADSICKTENATSN